MVKLTNIPNYMERIRYALNAASEERFCPPDSELFTARKSDQMQRHLDNCESCRDRLEAFIEFEYTPQNSSQQTTSTQQRPASGDLWTIRPDLAGWDDSGRYFNSPTILVLNFQDNQTILAAQTCGIEELAYQGDLILDAPYAGFVEPWNTKFISIDSLEKKVGEVSTNLVKTVCKYEETAPVDTLPFLIKQFRRQECEVADYVESKSKSLVTPSYLARLFEVPVGYELLCSDEKLEHSFAAATTTIEREVPGGEGGVIANIESSKGKITIRFVGLDSYGSVLAGLFNKTRKQAIPLRERGGSKTLQFSIRPGAEAELYFDPSDDINDEFEIVLAAPSSKE
ncbi:hypothetical protein [uncultured Pseudodesulfovibrio sp.]|uniref:hypothetical protein n=1 Tax=uncultured Pseudodesulfovibrio sp. TaxID=2035858 RepID=UPI0029C912EF|nr:hypothetical protein [uncultured Pseudodesulfovibrio sp.]